MSFTWEQSRIKLEVNIAATAVVCLPCRCIGDRSMGEIFLKLPDREDDDSSRSEREEEDVSNFILIGVIADVGLGKNYMRKRIRIFMCVVLCLIQRIRGLIVRGPQ